MSFGLCTGVNLEGLNNDNNNEKRIVLCVDQECSRPITLPPPPQKKKKKKKNPLSLFPANAYSLHSSLLRDEVDMVSAVSLPHSVEAIPTVWPGFGLLRSASSPHEDPLRVPRTNPPREFCVFAQMRAYKGSGSSVGKKEQLWGVVVRNEKKKKMHPDDKEQRLDHQGIVEVFVCLHVSCLFPFVPRTLALLPRLCVMCNHPRPQIKFLPFHLNFKHLIKAFVWPGLKSQSQLL